MMYFSLDYLLRQVSSWVGGAVEVMLGGKSVEAACSVCGSNWHCVCQGVVRVPPNPCEPRTSRNGAGSTLTLLLNARGHLVRITRRQPVLGIDHPQEAIGWNLSVDEHELCDPCA